LDTVQRQSNKNSPKQQKLAVWLLAVGCWLLAVGYWLMAVGCWRVLLWSEFAKTNSLHNKNSRLQEKRDVARIGVRQ
jgi:hypothetical protein